MTERTALRLIYAISAAVFLAVVAIYNLPQADHIPPWVKHLPAANAALNSACTLLLVTSFAAIRRGRVALHKSLNLVTFVLSALFLLSYVTFHTFVVETRFPKDNPVRPIYLAILLSHIVLAAIVLPLVLAAFYQGLTGRIEKHRRIVRWAFPVWLYVTASGVVVYLMISPYYGF